ncbi:tRNA uridine 5-carboxymethylaminomethyl modification enzyme MnmG [Bienertia sinuspersici]
MDKEWMKLKNRGAPQYLEGIDRFLDFAFYNSSVDHRTKIKCPCCKCANVHYKTRSQVRFDLQKNGILQSYIIWDKHGEKYNDVPLDSEAINVDNGDCHDDQEMLDMLQVGCGVAGMELLEKEFDQIHFYALNNCYELLELVKEHKDILASENPTPRSIERRQKVQFADWVRNRTKKQKYGSNFTSRLQVCLTAHEAENLTPREGNCVDENPLKRVRTKYMHENRLHERQGTQLNDPNSSEASTTSAKRKKGQRGKYRSLALEKKSMGGLFKLDVHIPDYVLQAVEKNARLLVNFCGYVVRTTTFMDAGDWRDVFAKHGHSMWLQVKNKFNIKDSTTNLLRLETFVTDAMQRLYRFWKARLHYYYEECEDTLEERINNPPADIPIESWKACCAKFEKRSLQNSKNRRSDKWTKHTTGNLSFPEVEHILTETNGNVLPDPDVAQLHQLVKDKDKEPEGNESRPSTQEEMLLHVVGPKSGYTQGKGNGYRGSAKARLQEEQQKIIQNQQDQISNL